MASPAMHSQPPPEGSDWAPAHARAAARRRPANTRATRSASAQIGQLRAELGPR